MGAVARLREGLRVREYRFTPQPEWERIACTNPTGAAIDVQIAAGKSSDSNSAAPSRPAATRAWMAAS